MSGSIQCDHRQWDRAIVEYSAATHKTLADSENRQMKNLAIKAAAHIKVAVAGKIDALKVMPWWPKFVAKRLSHRLGKQTASGIVKAAWAKGKGQALGYNENVWLQHMKEESARILRGRKSGIQFMKAFVSSMAKAMDSVVPSLKAPATKPFKGFVTSVSPATPSNHSCEIRTEYDYRHLGKGTIQKAEAIGNAALQAAIPETIADMTKYAEEELAKVARRHSA